jgi:uncharacterized protein YecE (DUF72 family)
MRARRLSPIWKCGLAIVSPAEQAHSMSKVFIGASGWSYDGWRGPFYPANVAKKRWLAWYATNFTTAEINGSFYRTPSLETVRGWREQTPKDFVFAWKASKFITHWKRLSASLGAIGDAASLYKENPYGPYDAPMASAGVLALM